MASPSPAARPARGAARWLPTAAAGLRLLVARPGHLLVQKLLADRPQDRLDVEQLLPRCDEGEVARARRAATLVVERGFDRGIDLSARLEQALAPR